ncbi:carboxypeptidase-like regulatory domain-containing protein, partial [Acinetobacter baumannii]
IAQTRSVTGSVTDSKGGPIPFAAVIIKGTKQGVPTDADGRFVIKAKTGDVLEVVAQGMLKKEVPVTAENIFVISIDRDEKETL